MENQKYQTLHTFEDNTDQCRKHQAAQDPQAIQRFFKVKTMQTCNNLDK